MTQPVRIDPELLDSAKRAGSEQGRSAAQQIAHWARIGRELDTSSSLTSQEHRRISAAAYDQLDPAAQAVVRAEWEDAFERRIASLDMAAEFATRAPAGARGRAEDG